MTFIYEKGLGFIIGLPFIRDLYFGDYSNLGVALPDLQVSLDTKGFTYRNKRTHICKTWGVYKPPRYQVAGQPSPEPKKTMNQLVVNLRNCF